MNTKEKFIRLANALSAIETKGESTLLMADCIKFCQQCVKECEQADVPEPVENRSI